MRPHQTQRELSAHFAWGGDGVGKGLSDFIGWPSVLCRCCYPNTIVEGLVMRQKTLLMRFYGTQIGKSALSATLRLAQPAEHSKTG